MLNNSLILSVCVALLTDFISLAICTYLTKRNFRTRDNSFGQKLAFFGCITQCVIDICEIAHIIRLLAIGQFLFKYSEIPEAENLIKVMYFITTQNHITILLISLTVLDRYKRIMSTPDSRQWHLKILQLQLSLTASYITTTAILGRLFPELKELGFFRSLGANLKIMIYLEVMIINITCQYKLVTVICKPTDMNKNSSVMFKRNLKRGLLSMASLDFIAVSFFVFSLVFSLEYFGTMAIQNLAKMCVAMDIFICLWMLEVMRNGPNHDKSLIESAPSCSESQVPESVFQIANLKEKK